MNIDENNDRKVGRPRKYGRRSTVTFRLQANIKAAVEQEASETKRSLSEVCEAIITKHFMSMGLLR